MQANQTPTLVPLAFAAGGAFNAIPEASQIGTNPGGASLVDGFPPLTRTPITAGGIPPSGLDMNGILNLITQSTRWTHAGGRYGFSSTFAGDTNVGGYPAGAMLMSADGFGTWLSLVDNNSDNPDTGPGTKWAPSQAYGFSAISGLTNANVTLTPAQAMKSRIVLTGALTGNVQIILPAWTREWTIVNNTTGAFTITAKTASGTGVAIPAGAARVVCDGTNVTQPAESIAAATLSSHALTAGQIGAIGGQGNLPINTSAKVNGVNAANLLFNGSGEFGNAGWNSSIFSATADSTGGNTYFSNASSLTGSFVQDSSISYVCGAGVQLTLQAVLNASGLTAGGITARIEAFNSSNVSLGNVALLTGISFGTADTFQSATGVTPAGTAYYRVNKGTTGSPSGPAGAVSFRRIKVEYGNAVSLYSQEASITAIGSSPLAPARVRLTQNTTFYVNATTGSDSNNGTTSTSAWATLQKAWNTIQSNYDVAGFTATVNVAAGSYAPVAGIGAVVGSISASSVQFVATGAATVTNTSGVACFYATGGAQFTYSGPWTLINNNSGASTAQSSGAGSILIQGAGVTHGASAGSHLLANAYGQIQATGNYTVSGSSGSHLNAANAGALGINSGVTITLSGTPAFSTAFAQANGLSQINAGSVTFSGSATGSRYISQSNSMVNSNGGGASYFPGSTAGTTNTGGIYI
ncbi:beta strand repeat-containing protein [Burkholderia cenocepacia]|uniref:beta strand repeat-containing protein n=1 Tax=Burkholderia cenocepacia TaxID=95486 RepID=UPI001C2168C1|nr:hypothetical protein [Burkholderia cenocepacia]MBU9656053.1 hypothetical protein [Burkholderia cenocepacia]